MFTRGLTATEVRRRLPRLCGSFVLLGVAVALMVRADLGLGPWDVLHQGVSDLIGVPIGTVGIIVGLIVLVAWIPLEVRPGLGTVLNVTLIGASVDVALAVLPTIPPSARGGPSSSSACSCSGPASPSTFRAGSAPVPATGS